MVVCTSMESRFVSMSILKMNTGYYWISSQLGINLLWHYFLIFVFFHDFFRFTRPIWPRFWPNSKLSLIHVFRRVFLGMVVVVRNSGLRPQYYILTLQRMFKSTSSGYRVDKLGFVSCIRPLKIFCRSLGHIGPVVLDKTLKYRKIIMQICLPIGKKATRQIVCFLHVWVVWQEKSKGKKGN